MTGCIGVLGGNRAALRAALLPPLFLNPMLSFRLKALSAAKSLREKSPALICVICLFSARFAVPSEGMQHSEKLEGEISCSHCLICLFQHDLLFHLKARSETKSLREKSPYHRCRTIASCDNIT
jgi:hypothetical protein